MATVAEILKALDLEYTHRSTMWTDSYFTKYCEVEVRQVMHERGSRKRPELMHELVYVNGLLTDPECVQAIIEMHHNL